MVAKDSNIIHGSNGEGSTGAVDHEVHRVTSAVRIPHDLAKGHRQVKMRIEL